MVSTRRSLPGERRRRRDSAWSSSPCSVYIHCSVTFPQVGGGLCILFFCFAFRARECTLRITGRIFFFLSEVSTIRSLSRNAPNPLPAPSHPPRPPLSFRASFSLFLAIYLGEYSFLSFFLLSSLVRFLFPLFPSASSSFLCNSEGTTL